MQVLIDRDEGWIDHWIETDPVISPQVEHPDGTGKKGIDQMLLWHNDHPESRTAGGWDIVNQLEGETEPLTRWRRLVRACNGPNATDQAKSLGLHE